MTSQLRQTQQTNDTDQQPHPYSDHDEVRKTPSRTESKYNSKDTDTVIPSNSDSVVDLYSNLKVGCIKNNVKICTDKSLHQHCSTKGLSPDSSNSIIMTPPSSHRLPNEIILLIIHHLTNQQKNIREITLVSKQFHAVANPLLWQVINLRDKSSSRRFLARLSDTSQHRLETIGQHIQELSLSAPHWTDAQLLRLLPHIPSLERLSIYPETHITDTSFEHLPRHCQHLTSLKLFLLPLTHVSFSAIGQHCHRLRDLEWNLRDQQSLEWLEWLKDCPLERLVLISHHKPPNENTMTIIRTFDHLTCLKINHRHFAYMNLLLVPTTGNNHDGSAAVTTLWPQLTKLTLNVCSQLDDPTLVGFIKSHPHLQELHLRCATTLTDTSLDAMAVYLPKLTHMTMTANDHVTPNGVRRLVCRCRRLENLKFSYCRYVEAMYFPELLGFGCRNYSVVMDPSMIGKVREHQQQLGKPSSLLYF